MSTTDSYSRRLVHDVGSSWNRFWFRTEAWDSIVVGRLRAIVGLVALYFQASFTPDLIRWFGPDGILPVEKTQQLLGTNVYWQVHPSLLWFADSEPVLLAMHVGGFLVLLAFAIGFRTELMKWLAAIVVLSYVHRAPMIGGPLEPVLTMLMCYLCLTKCGTHFAVDAWRSGGDGASVRNANSRSLGTHVGLRLIQVHVAALYLVMALNKLAGPVWWNGYAMWWLVAHTESRLVDFTWLHDYSMLVDAWTHSVVLFELAFPVLIWIPILRPLLSLLAVVHWGLITLVTGNVALAVLMVATCVAYMPPNQVLSSASRDR